MLTSQLECDGFEVPEESLEDNSTIDNTTMRDLSP